MSRALRSVCPNAMKGSTCASRKAGQLFITWVLLALQYFALAVVAGLAVGAGNYTTEELGFRLCKYMERHGQMRRLAPGTKRIYEASTLRCSWC